MINLLPLEEKESVLRIRRVRFVTLSSMFLFYVGLIGSIALFPSYILSKEKERESTLSYQRLQNDEYIKEKNSLNQAVDDINKKLAILPGESFRNYSSTFFDEVLNRRANLVTIESISYRKNNDGIFEASISGTAKTRSSLILFVDELKSVEGFSGVEVPISNLVKDRNIVFKLDFTLP